ncbi:MAG: hypothetical protein J07HB67_00830 [halophilic archaeon J07HB67]|jgi:hypothetical protein|nr:MAG: hypothetical protein J07HB67_00830 [halophilic archaeon J07HB67]
MMANTEDTPDETETDEIVTDGGHAEPADPAKALLQDAVSL